VSQGMAGAQVVGFRPLSRLTLKPPQPFTAGVHGPGSFGTTLSYPAPTTVAGALISLYANGPIRVDPPPTNKPFGDLADALHQAIYGSPGGESDCRGDLEIYTGLLLNTENGRLHAYINKDIFPSVSEIANILHGEKPILKLQEPPVDKSIRAVRGRFTGIALERGTKNVLQQHLYSIESILYKPQAEIIAIVTTSKQPPQDKPVKLGSKSGLALAHTIAEPKIKATTIDNYTLEQGTHLLLITPALIEAPKDNPANTGTIILTSKNLKNGLPAKLVKKRGDGQPGTLLLVPKGEHTLSVYTTGWSERLGMYRKPMLVIPPGTLIKIDKEIKIDNKIIKIELKIKSKEEESKKEEILLTKIGDHTNIGWGTALIIPPKQPNPNQTS